MQGDFTDHEIDPGVINMLRKMDSSIGLEESRIIEQNLDAPLGRFIELNKMSLNQRSGDLERNSPI